MKYPARLNPLFVVALALSVYGDSLPFRANFSDSPQPFNIDVDKDFIDNTVLKASLTRFVTPVDEKEYLEGPPVHNATTVRDYWVNEYNWYNTQNRLNQKLHQYTTTVKLNTSAQYSQPIPLHFVHHRSPRVDAIPLLFIHGWPGSFIEVENIIDGLTNPPNATLPAFHVVAPSIPGFAFSPAVVATGFGDYEAAQAFHALMMQLEYEKYVIQAGDVGGIILRYQAHLFPDNVLAGLDNFWVVSPSETDRERYSRNQTTADETYIIDSLDSFFDNLWGYGQIQQTRPLKLAHAMTDSPVGLAMWIYDAVIQAVENRDVWTPEEIITWTMMHYIQGPYGGFRLYREGALNGAFNLTAFNDLPPVSQPVAISEFPLDIWYRTPLEWAQRTGNVQKRYIHDYGGHFPAWETPDLLLDDIWDFFGDLDILNSYRQIRLETGNDVTI
ncbi:Alpha/Beta hydrolase protein [Talaromyces proteolyticus]|uniref:Alpha/Beta hydrolase protein n=1 Tax=Talaromyces proteolyticus TaxID=1131652 RepID=A0AAD4L3F2_9EURO|nr:Alpha/Beta hydrolase protein [Talaromyces proteolyticus]KAH8705876.1 Alpha/Beta hydrolase protein [Talaromyces proteolyticus]